MLCVHKSRLVEDLPVALVEGLAVQTSGGSSSPD